jgi:hypothetical protein
MTSLTIGSVFAQDAKTAAAVNPDYFTFKIGSLGVYTLNTSSLSVMNAFGIQLQLTEKYSAGFSIIDSGAFVNVTATPKTNVSVSLYSGQISSSMAFGLGTGYDFFTKKDNFFTSMGVYADWYACSDDTLDAALANGGILAIGLETKLGL